MTSLPTLRRKLEAAADGSTYGDARYLERRQKQRHDFIESAYELGGQGFTDRVRRYGCTEKGERLSLSPWFEEALMIVGDLRLHHVLTTGCAQVGKTLINNLLVADCLTTGRLNTCWFYDSRTNLDANVPMQSQPVIEFWVAQMGEDGYRFKRNRDRTINTRYQVEGATAIFSYVSTTRLLPAKREGTAVAGGAAVSFQADIAFLEERSQYPPGAADPIPRRLDASMLPTRPIRELGTPGGGQGIEASMGDVDHYFYPHFTCANCEQLHPLDPKGCLLRSSTIRDPLGRPKISFLSESGRPLTWFHSDPEYPVDSAYFGCPNCGHPIADEQRYNAKFCCRYTGVWAADFTKSLTAGVPDRHWKIGLHFSPLSRVELADQLAPQIIKSGFDSVNSDDWQQQRLGHPSEHQTNMVTLEMLRLAMAAPKLDRRPSYTLAGVDIGRSEDWVVIADFYLPSDAYSLTPGQLFEQTVRQVRFAGGVFRERIPEMLDDYGVEYGLVDNEPSRESSMKLCQGSCLEMADQLNIREPLKETIVEDGGLAYKCWQIRNVKFMSAVLEGFLLRAEDEHSLYRLPSEWDQWVGNPSDMSPLIHLSAPWRDADGQWHRGQNNVDDIFFACVFLEAAFYRKLLMPEEEYSISGVGERPIRELVSRFL